MKKIAEIILIIFFTSIIFNFTSQKKESFNPQIVYKSADLIITQVSENSFQHTSFIQTNDFGNVPCNGLIVRDNNEVIIFDTTTDEKSSEELINWLNQKLNYKINAVIATHFHDDCLGGLKAFHEKKIPSYAYFKTIEFVKENNSDTPENSFKDSLILKVGKEKIIAKFFGEGHTKDNIVGYFPSENILFGGCLIKELDASKGYLGDANVADWPETVEKVKKQYPNAKTVIPGHGEFGNKDLLDYTIQLFRK